jgi:hypothetical protein
MAPSAQDYFPFDYRVLTAHSTEEKVLVESRCSSRLLSTRAMRSSRRSAEVPEFGATVSSSYYGHIHKSCIMTRGQNLIYRGDAVGSHKEVALS